MGVDGGDAVDHESGAGEVAACIGVAEDAAAVGEVDPFEFRGAAEGLDGGCEAFDLGVGEGFVFIGGGEVGGDAFEFEVGKGGKLVEGGEEVIGEEAAAAHAGIDGDVGFEPGVVFFRDGVEGGGFGDGGDAGGDVAGDDFLSFGVPCGTEEVDGCGDSGEADAASLADVGDAEESDSGFGECLGYFFQAVSVCACLDDGHDFAAGDVLSDIEVMAEVACVDFDPSAGWRSRDGGIVHRC